MKNGIFEYVNLKKQNLTSKTGKSYTRYVVVSDTDKETKAIKDKLAQLGFEWNGREWWMFGNRLTQEILDGLKQINAELKEKGGQVGNIDEFLAKLDELKTEIQDSSMPARTKSELEAKLEQYVHDIANATDERAASAELNKFLEFSHKFHTYSFSNIMLIYLQDQNATKVAGEKTWKNKFNRTVIDRRKAISIWCGNKFYEDPNSGKLVQYTLDQQKKDNDYTSKVEAGIVPFNQNEINAIQKRRNTKRMIFNPCVVYDVANTSGEPLPEEPNWKPTFDNDENANALFEIAKKSMQKMGISIPAEVQNASGSGAVAIVFSKWAEALLHQAGGKFEGKALDYFQRKGDLTHSQISQIKKIQSEGVSGVLCRHFNIPQEYHPTQMAMLQAQGRLSSQQLIKENVSTITDVSNFILTQIKANQAEFSGAETPAQPQETPEEQ